MNPFYIIEPKAPKVPIIISVPHCGTEFPYELLGHYDTIQSNKLDDTDWFVDKLYEFASEMGITIIKARFHRWVIDLNRDPESKPLYHDGRIITSLCSTTDFFGNNIYLNSNYEPNSEEVKRRLKKYYWPYYQEIQHRIDELKNEFGDVLFYDAHSIRKLVPTIQNEPFPDLILGTNDQEAASLNLIKLALEHLGNSKYQLAHNTPFKGGHLTRYFGKPSEKQHALQLERTKNNYMDDTETQYSEDRANNMIPMLQKMFKSFILELKQMP